MNKINWKVRVKNPQFWIQIVLIVVTTMLGYAGISGSEVNTWRKVGEIIVATISNPYTLVMIGVGVYNAIIDPTTKGMSDSKQALTYDEPKKEEE